MERGKCEESRKVGSVTTADAGTHPGTMVVVELDATVALVAVKGSRWSQQIAGLTIRELEDICFRILQ
jgi:hypothetical protein